MKRFGYSVQNTGTYYTNNNLVDLVESLHDDYGLSYGEVAMLIKTRKIKDEHLGTIVFFEELDNEEK